MYCDRCGYPMVHTREECDYNHRQAMIGMSLIALIFLTMFALVFGSVAQW